MEERKQGETRYKSIEDKYPSPCIGCNAKYCVSNGKYCTPWKTRYLYRQKAINGYARKYQIQPTEAKDAKDPCERCSSNEYCDTICPARAKWWDAQMEKLKKEWKSSD